MHIVCDHGVLAAHDTSDSNRLLAVADHQHVLIHGTLLAVKSDEFLALASTADNDLMVCNGVKVVSVHWLSELFHYIVCNINQVVDRADSVGSQAALHPFRGRSDLYIFYHSCTVTRAKLRFLYSYFHVVGCFLIVSCHLYFRRAEFLAEGSGCFSCDSKNAVAVYTVGSNLIFKYNVVKSKCLDRTLAHNCIFRENIDSVFRSFRIHVAVASKLFNGAHHTV